MPILQENEAKQIIVKVYNNDSTRPLCRYLDSTCARARCNASLKKVKTEDEFGPCTYYTKW